MVLSIAPLQLTAAVSLQQAAKGVQNADGSTSTLKGFKASGGGLTGLVGGLVGGGAKTGTLVNGVPSGQLMTALMTVTGVAGESSQVNVPVKSISSGRAAGRKLVQQACPPVLLVLERTPTGPTGTVDGITVEITSTPGGVLGEVLCLVGRLLAPVGGLINLAFVANLLSQLLGSAGLGVI